MTEISRRDLLKLTPSVVGPFLAGEEAVSGPVLGPHEQRVVDELNRISNAFGTFRFDQLSEYSNFFDYGVQKLLSHVCSIPLRDPLIAPLGDVNNLSDQGLIWVEIVARKAIENALLQQHKDSNDAQVANAKVILINRESFGNASDYEMIVVPEEELGLGLAISIKGTDITNAFSMASFRINAKEGERGNPRVYEAYLKDQPTTEIPNTTNFDSDEFLQVFDFCFNSIMTNVYYLQTGTNIEPTTPLSTDRGKTA